MDGIMKDMVGAPRSQPDWASNNPSAAAREFIKKHPGFIIEEPVSPFNEGNIESSTTYFPDGYIKRILWSDAVVNPIVTLLFNIIILP